MFKKGGEFQLSASGGNGFEVQSALSVSKHIGIIGNYSYASQRQEDDVNDYQRHEFLEGGIGYFENQQSIFIEVFLGYGKGSGRSRDRYFFFSPQSEYATGKYERFFIQPAFGLNQKTMHVSFVPRFSLVDFYEFSDDVTTVTVDQRPIVFFEPAVIGRVNFAEEKLFFVFQAGLSASFMDEPYFDRRSFHMSAGLGFRLGGKTSNINRNTSAD